MEEARLKAEKANELGSWDEGAIESTSATKHQNAESDTGIGGGENSSTEGFDRETHSRAMRGRMGGN